LKANKAPAELRDEDLAAKLDEAAVDLSLVVEGAPMTGFSAPSTPGTPQ
jgi:hypothetical protein